MALIFTFFCLLTTFTNSELTDRLNNKNSRRLSSQFIIKPLTQDEKIHLLAEHNNYRKSIALGYQSLPKASNMNELFWSKTLEKVSQAWADHLCEIVNDGSGTAPYSLSNKPGHNYDQTTIGLTAFSNPLTDEFAFYNNRLGENIAWKPETNGWNITTISSSLKDFFDEVGAKGGWTYAPYNADTMGPDYGHFTAMVWGKSRFVGCGVSNANNCGSVLVCNYWPQGNVNNMNVWESGDPCTNCDWDRVNSLCLDNALCSGCYSKHFKTHKTLNSDCCDNGFGIIRPKKKVTGTPTFAPLPHDYVPRKLCISSTDASDTFSGHKATGEYSELRKDNNIFVKIIDTNTQRRFYEDDKKPGVFVVVHTDSSGGSVQKIGWCKHDLTKWNCYSSATSSLNQPLTGVTIKDGECPKAAVETGPNCDYIRITNPTTDGNTDFYGCCSGAFKKGPGTIFTQTNEQGYAKCAWGVMYFGFYQENSETNWRCSYQDSTLKGGVWKTLEKDQNAFTSPSFTSVYKGGANALTFECINGALPVKTAAKISNAQLLALLQNENKKRTENNKQVQHNEGDNKKSDNGVNNEDPYGIFGNPLILTSLFFNSLLLMLIGYCAGMNCKKRKGKYMKVNIMDSSSSADDISSCDERANIEMHLN